MGQYLSVSKLVGQYKVPFKKDEISKFVADRDGIPQAEVLQDWELKRVASVKRGISLHSFAKKHIESGGKFTDCFDVGSAGVCYQFQLWYQENFKKFDWSTAIVETRLLNEEFMISGDADLIVFCPSEDCWYFFDWKSNSKFNTVGRDPMLTPFDSIMGCHLSEYSMQIGIYERIYRSSYPEMMKARSSLNLVHFSSDRWQNHVATDLSQQINMVLHIRKSKIK